MPGSPPPSSCTTSDPRRACARRATNTSSGSSRTSSAGPGTSNRPGRWPASTASPADSMDLMRYLLRQASEDSPRANSLVAEIIDLTKRSMASQTAKGYVRPSATTLTCAPPCWSCCASGLCCSAGQWSRRPAQTCCTPTACAACTAARSRSWNPGSTPIRSPMKHTARSVRRHHQKETPVTTDTTAPALTGRKRWVALLFLALGVAMIILDGTVVNVAIPTIVEDLGSERRPTPSGSTPSTRCCSHRCCCSAAACPTSSVAASCSSWAWPSVRGGQRDGSGQHVDPGVRTHRRPCVAGRRLRP
jgi:hypothetical protein